MSTSGEEVLGYNSQGLSEGGEEDQAKENFDADDDDPPQLSAHALAALQEFYAEQAQAGTSHTRIVSEDWVRRS